MFIGGHRSVDWGGVEPEAEFLLKPSMVVLPCCTSPVRALLRGHDWRRSARPSHTLGQTHTAVLFLHLWTGGWGEKGGGTQYMSGAVDGPTERLGVGLVMGPAPGPDCAGSSRGGFSPQH